MKKAKSFTMYFFIYSFMICIIIFVMVKYTLFFVPFII